MSPRKNKGMLLAEYCAMQCKLISLYDPGYDASKMLSEVGPYAIEAMKSPSKEHLAGLEKLSSELSSRISALGRQNPNVSKSKEFKDLSSVLDITYRRYHA